MNLRIALILLGVSCFALSCNDSVLTFPTPEPASMRIVNVTLNVPTVRVTIDSSIVVDADRGVASSAYDVPAGRPLSFEIGRPGFVYRTGLRYTLGGAGRTILFVRGDTSSVVEFRRVIHDTILTIGSDSAVIRFTHMAELVDRAYFVDVWMSDGTRLLPEEFEPGISSVRFKPIASGTYSFQVRESGKSNVLATLTNVTIQGGKSYMLYTYDSAPPVIDSIALQIF